MSENDISNILLVNDLAGYGKVALAAMIPILSHMKYELFTLPTALVSNTLDYGKFEILDTADYIEKTIEVWRKLGFSFDAISTGFIASDTEAEILCDFCGEQKQKGTLIFVDPIMADDGKLYNGINKKIIQSMRKMVASADLVKPNYTEACFLTESEYCTNGVSWDDGKQLLDRLCKIGAKSAVITSIPIDNIKCCIGLDADRNEYFKLSYDELPVRFPGTGDIFSSILIGNILSDKDLKNSTDIAMKIVKEMIKENINNIDRYRGIPIEQYLYLID